MTLEHRRLIVLRNFVVAIPFDDKADALLMPQPKHHEQIYREPLPDPVPIPHQVATEYAKELRLIPEMTSKGFYPGWRDRGLPGDRFMFWGLPS